MTKFHENVTLLNVEIKKEKKKLQLLLYITRILYVIHKTDDNFKFTIETEKERETLHFLLQKKTPNRLIKFQKNREKTKDFKNLKCKSDVKKNCTISILKKYC